ncbi:MAG: peptide-methionine (S)-S-oxide reductase MsrA [Calditrichaceae bacterium]|nr:peptide-methionine (S)-S-oxide reductase MsrA [Calditrichaceae bacterium]MBN2707971.1 peptide-methionine (S)-S-oxide reductase MsrA [Calditrichaceae bacterium]RQV95928.1 MAG: peptide-methionine (S)-S-oxide reductase [Calditrichota bacterium]
MTHLLSILTALFLLFNVLSGQTKTNEKEMNMGSKSDTATLGAGCFWCVEAIFENLNGVEKVISGYSGGHVENPSYQEVCTGETGHAEAVQIQYDPAVISFEEILNVFWRTHDPTTLNRQGGDVGTQYRSAIFYHNEEQKKIAEKSKAEIDQSGLWEDPIVTEITSFTNFYKAESYHQNYFAENPDQAYCRIVINPKVEKFKKNFKDQLKK